MASSRPDLENQLFRHRACNRSSVGLAGHADTEIARRLDFPATAAFAASTERHSAANTNVRLSITDTANGLGDSTSAWTVAAKVWP